MKGRESVGAASFERGEDLFGLLVLTLLHLEKRRKAHQEALWSSIGSDAKVISVKAWHELCESLGKAVSGG